MKVAVIGAGISGLTAAFRLHASHDVTVLEANDYIGGHTNTVDVPVDGNTLAIDTGFIVFNRRTYPNFCKLLEQLGVTPQPTVMSFSVRCDETGLEYRGADFAGLFAQRRNLINPRFYRLLGDVLRFNRESQQLLQSGDDSLTVREFFERENYSAEFIQKYFLPMGSAIWSCPRDAFEQFPIRFIVSFYQNHGLLSVNDRPQWQVIRGGSRNYVEKMTRPFRNRIRTNCRVRSIHRSVDNVTVLMEPGERESFDHVVLACHSDQALRLLGNEATKAEHEILSAFPYERNVAVLHTDTSVLPRCRRAWASWNYHLRSDDPQRATVSYNMNILQRIKSRHTYCVTLNGEERIDPRKVIKRIIYHHPVFTTNRRSAQQRRTELIDSNRTSYCGAYWGNGFHEDGVNSALAVVEALQQPGSGRASSLDFAGSVA